jgi:hypothetical protein
MAADDIIQRDSQLLGLKIESSQKIFHTITIILTSFLDELFSICERSCYGGGSPSMQAWPYQVQEQKIEFLF